jgi:hypothetical protein
MTVKYFDLYSLNFNNFNVFCAQIETFPENAFKSELCNAKTAKHLTERFQKEQAFYELLNSVMETTQELKPKELFKQEWEAWNTSRENFKNLQAQFYGADPYDIQHLVNIVLGISEDDRFPCSLELRTDCFALMKKTDFLVTKYEPFNKIDNHLPKYQPGILASKFLEEHSDIQTLTIGCGWKSKHVGGICYTNKHHEHIAKSFDIDLFAAIGPDLVISMHNEDFWKSIPNDRFNIIQDHTNTNILFEGDSSAQTIQAIFRTLKPGGKLCMDHYFEEKDIAQLKNSGFKVTGNTEAQKPTEK